MSAIIQLNKALRAKQDMITGHYGLRMCSVKLAHVKKKKKMGPFERVGDVARAENSFS